MSDELLLPVEAAAYTRSQTSTSTKEIYRDDHHRTIQLAGDPQDRRPAVGPRRPPGRRWVPDRRTVDRADLPIHRRRDQHGQLVLQREDRSRRRAGEARLRGRGPTALPDGPRPDDTRR